MENVVDMSPGAAEERAEHPVGHPAEGATRVRRSVWRLTSVDEPWDPITEAYARGVRVMQSRPVGDPTSWAFQAAVHGTRRTAPPGIAWNECKHGGWYFLSWHRMYVYFLERIVRAAVVEAGGPEDFALPYWDYDRPAPDNTLPPPFRQPQLPDGTPNPLFLDAPLRSPGIVAGGGLPPAATSAAAALARPGFVGTTLGFGGGITGTDQFNGSTGAVEQTPHNAIHVLLGGQSDGACGQGLMSDPACAALDPVFWLHHGNVDRLWNRWLALGGPRANPSDAAWLDQAFPFHDETGAAVSLTGAEVVDAAAQLGYLYDDEVPATPRTQTMDETAGTGASGSSASGPPGPAGDGSGSGPPELAAASGQPVELAGATVSVPLAVPPSTLALVQADEVARGRTVYLNVEDIEAERNPGVVYAVYVNLPAGASTADRARHHAGNVSLFGVEAMNDPDRPHDGPPGMRHTFDVTALVADLSVAGEWDPEAIAVTFEPVGLLPPEGTPAAMDDDVDTFRGTPGDEVAAAAARPVRIGRVSLFVV